MSRPETMLVNTGNGPVMINKTDFDPAIHTIDDEQVPFVEPPAPVVPAAPVAVDENGNPVNAGDGGEMVLASTAMLVQKKGKKFFVVDAATKEPIVGRAGIDEAGYGDENAAWIAVAQAGAPNAG